MLVRTPPHKPTESLFGYVLRLSEANGYDTPWHVLTYAGHSQAEMGNPGMPVDRLAAVAGLSSGGLDDIAYSAIDSEGKKKYQLLGHSLGKRLSYAPLRRDKPQLCPHCVREHGYIDAFFDLNLAVACPAHQCTLISGCHVCGETLTRFRPGLLTCKCGASLSDAPTVRVSLALADLMAIIWAKLHGNSTETLRLHAGLPVNDLIAAPLYPLLLKLPVLGRLNAVGIDASRLSYAHIVESAATLLANWPNGITPFLMRLRSVNENEVREIGSRKSFNQLFNQFFDGRYASPDFSWFRDELLRYRWQNKTLVKSEKTVGASTTKAELANRLGFAKVSLSEWAEQARACEEAGGTVQVRAAAAYLELPVRILQALQSSGHLPRRPGSALTGWFHLADLDAFRQELLALSPLLGAEAEQTEDLVDLARVLRESRFHRSEGKAGFVLAYLSGDIPAFGRTGDTLKDIQFRQADVAVFVGRSRAMAAGDSVSQKEAAVLVGCDARGLPGLLDSGHLIAEPGREGLRVSRESIARFSTQYVALSSLAKEMGTSSRRLLRLAKAGDVNVLLVNGGQLGPVPFVKCEDVSLMRRLSEQSPARTTNPDFKCRALIAVSQYLAGLRENNEPLPRCGAKPNKRDIAQACGLDRSVFYNNEAVSKLVARYVEEGLTSCP